MQRWLRFFFSIIASLLHFFASAHRCKKHQFATLFLCDQQVWKQPAHAMRANERE